VITVGLTGGIASGKSLVADMLKGLGAYIIDSDSIARDVVKPGCEGWHGVVQEFGQQILTATGEIDREKLGNIIFSHEGSRQTLNALLHPPILLILKQQITAIGKQDPQALVVAVVPLLIECGLQNDFDAVIVVWAPEDMQAQRLMRRNGLTREDALQRIRAQMLCDEKRNFATYIIDNDRDIAHTEQQVREIYLKLKNMAAEKNMRQK
jgi:dephospho-CoA kinase